MSDKPEHDPHAVPPARSPAAAALPVPACGNRSHPGAAIAGLITVAERERLLLAPYAMHSAASRGRQHDEPVHLYRGPYQRDRDRIVHSAAFRRLSGKMQVFTGERGDYHRTRMTHTQEVASIARTIARALRLNEDLVEALALFHDIGHPPFGHAGEDALAECLRDHGGFSHNRYALTIAQQLEMPYPEFPGLNLSHEVLEGQSSRVHKQGRPRLLEVQLVDAADSITYDAHDTDDAVKLGLVTLDELAELSLIQASLAAVRGRYSGLADWQLRKAVVHDLIDRQVGDLLRHSGRMLFAVERGERTLDSVTIEVSPEIAEPKRQLEAFLYERVYRHPELVAVRRDAQLALKALFEHYLAHPELMPLNHQRRIPAEGLPRCVGEYLAGMTDRFCNEQFDALENAPGGARQVPQC